MKITVVGHLCMDVIRLPVEQGGKEAHSLGGITYALLTLANLASPQDTILPVFGVGENEYDELMDLLGRYPVIDRSGIFQMNRPTNHVHLFYENNGQRVECSKEISHPIPFEKIKPFLSTDGVLINMVSGFDITLETLDLIRMEVRERHTPIHFDFHSLTLGVDSNAKRFRRPLTDWRRWCFMIKSIQMSEAEAHGLTPDRLNEQGLVNQLMPLMVNALIMTRGEGGLTLFEQHNKKLELHEIAGVPTQAVDPTGCGDVFGAAFLLHYLKEKNYPAAARFANEAAAFKATFSGLEGLDRLKFQRTASPEETFPPTAGGYQ